MEDVERKVILARGRMLVIVPFVGQRWVEGYLLWCYSWIFVLEEFCPGCIYGWTWLAKVEWKRWIHLSIYCVACLVEEEEVVEFYRSLFVRKRGFGDYLK